MLLTKIDPRPLLKLSKPLSIYRCKSSITSIVCPSRVDTHATLMLDTGVFKAPKSTSLLRPHFVTRREFSSVSAAMYGRGMKNRAGFKLQPITVKDPKTGAITTKLGLVRHSPASPNVYPKIVERLAKSGEAADSLNKPLEVQSNEANAMVNVVLDREEAIAKSREFYLAQKSSALSTGQSLAQPHVTSGESKNAEKENLRFMERLIQDGGEKILVVKQNYLHVEYTRFISLCDQMKGLALNDALLQAEWNRTPIGRHFVEGVFSSALVRAKESGFDFDKTYIADMYVKKNAAILAQHFAKRYLRGRGRYGSTPHPKTCLVELVLQERDRGFARRDADPLEWARKRLRLALKEGDRRVGGRDEGSLLKDGVDGLYAWIRQRRPVKEVYACD